MRSLLLVWFALWSQASAWIPHNPQTRLSVALQATGTTPEKVKSSGCGIPMQPAGRRHLFDPATDGKMRNDSVNSRIKQGPTFSYLHKAMGLPADVQMVEAQDWLEDIGVPTGTFKPAQPGQATVIGRTRLIDEDIDGDIQHVILQLPEGFRYVEGQSISVIPPGTQANGKPHKPRLYSIASTRYGDLLDGRTVSLCVRRAEFRNPDGSVDPEKKGVCSNFLCDAQPGDVVQVAGPVGKTMLLPETGSDQDLIFVATGTGIAPFRAFWQRLLMENTVAKHLYNGQIWLILGVPTRGGLLYPDEIAEIQQQVGRDKFGVEYALSREQTNADGSKRYVQDVLRDNAVELFDKLDKGAVIYFCGLKAMMPSILETLQGVAAQRGINWDDKLKELKNNGQWHVEVY